VPKSPNRLLASLPPSDFESLQPHLEPVDLVHEAVLFEAGDTVDRVYFGLEPFDASTFDAYVARSSPKGLAPAASSSRSARMGRRGVNHRGGRVGFP
jgi:hypothetical protein